METYVVCCSMLDHCTTKVKVIIQYNSNSLLLKFTRDVGGLQGVPKVIQDGDTKSILPAIIQQEIVQFRGKQQYICWF